MNGRPRAAVLAIVGLASSLAAQSQSIPSQPIPSHPGELVFAAPDFRLPAAPERHELTDGSIVYVREDHTLPLVEVALAVPVGVYKEAENEAGLARITGALLRRGGAGERDADDLDEAIDALGADLDSYSGDSRSGLSLTVPTWELPAALDLFFDILLHPRLEEDRLAVLESNLLESMSRRNQDPLEVLEREWAWLLFGRNQATRHATPSSLEAVTPQIVRAFHDRHWRTGRRIFAVSGDVEAKRIVAELDRRLSRPAAAAGLEDSGHGAAIASVREADAVAPADAGDAPITASAPENTVSAPLALAASPAGLYFSAHDSRQAKVLFGRRIETRLDWTDKERATLEVLREVVGGTGAISRLGGRLRTGEGLVYRVLAELEPGPTPTGFFRVFFEAETGSVARALELALAEIRRLRAELIHPRELQTVRETLLSRLLASFDTAEKVAGRYADDELLGRPYAYWAGFADNLKTVTREDVLAAARKYLEPSRFLYLIVGHTTLHEAELAFGGGPLRAATGFTITVLPRRDPLTLLPQEKAR